MAATSPRLGIDHLTVVPADPDRDDATGERAEGADATDDGDPDDP